MIPASCASRVKCSILDLGPIGHASRQLQPIARGVPVKVFRPFAAFRELIGERHRRKGLSSGPSRAKTQITTKRHFVAILAAQDSLLGAFERVWRGYLMKIPNRRAWLTRCFILMLIEDAAMWHSPALRGERRLEHCPEGFKMVPQPSSHSMIQQGHSERLAWRAPESPRSACVSRKASQGRLRLPRHSGSCSYPQRASWLRRCATMCA
jgi:hypothetical protein